MSWLLKSLSLLVAIAVSFGAGPALSVEVIPLPLVPGETALVTVKTHLPGPPEGEFAGQSLKFVRDGGNWVAFVGVHVLTSPGKHFLRVCLPSGLCQTSELPVVQKVYPVERIRFPAEKLALIRPEIVKEEREIVSRAYSKFSRKPLWFFPFSPPLKGELQITSHFGTLRAYGSSPPSDFHAGVDFRAEEGTLVYAPAPGRAVLARELILRGRMVILDHGAGVMSGFLHLSEIAIREGQEVRRGEIIGKVGNTGLSTAPHLHWEVRVNGVAVNPLTWFRESFRPTCSPSILNKALYRRAFLH
ncbi:MAG: M23 family metallopeptidase [Anaerolineae bacterium]|nr:M23 family metallopeptidase [Anaerolineae bacterium]MDW8102702.1 M23 family metallopeptidase [Anaerolineae bacterium]